ncbi:cytochrome P450 2K4-like isoform X2 [Corythoichthys intestinalis]|uniref:cytochrome P450 2K4-like isoform X2 n=1 Tax=Corythoichthys intestinalis TaxID=161448 RepID=UPI0025A56FA5|nr:cytochrome P450 2K4-like isoform X2 [Corythoichthys intestinalis]
MSISEDPRAESWNVTAPLACAAALFFLLLASRRDTSERGDKKDPPGPRPLPLLGNLLQLDLKWLDRALSKLAKQYGSVFSIYLGTRQVVVLAGYKALKEALVGNAVEFGERYVNPIFEEMNLGHGIIFSNGDTWKELRRFALSTLRDFGMGKRLAQDKILEECRYLIPVLEGHKGRPFNTTSPLSHATSNIICSIVYGDRFQYDDARFVSMVKRANDTIRMMSSVQIQLYNMFPRLFGWLKDRHVVVSKRNENMEDIRELLRQRKEKFNPEMCTGVVDCFFVRQRKEEEAGVERSQFNEENMMFVVANLFAAGTDTTSTTLQWSLLLMAKYPEIQERVFEELCQVVGSRPMDVDDRKNLPYTNAVIHEVQRFGNIAPMAILHQTTQDITFQDYFIRKGTAVIPLLSSVLYDESQWATPNTFNPSHFLDNEGKFVKKDAFMPFSAGRRVCLGEGLARMEIFLFFTSLIQRFRFTPPPGISEEELDLKPLVGFTLNPTPHELCAVRRQ